VLITARTVEAALDGEVIFSEGERVRFWIDPDGRLTYASPCCWAGLASTEVLGGGWETTCSCCAEVVEPPELTTIHSSDLQLWLNPYLEDLSTLEATLIAARAAGLYSGLYKKVFIPWQDFVKTFGNDRPLVQVEKEWWESAKERLEAIFPVEL